MFILIHKFQSLSQPQSTNTKVGGIKQHLCLSVPNTAQIMRAITDDCWADDNLNTENVISPSSRERDEWIHLQSFHPLHTIRTQIDPNKTAHHPYDIID